MKGVSTAIATLVANTTAPRLRPATGLQYAALPWRLKAGTLEILLVTSRQSKRWIIPKGWPIEGLSAPAAAAQEAFEEAGLVGKVSFERLGSYHYFKRLKNGVTVPCKVDVYPLEVMRQRREWPEKHQRTLKWCAAVEAATAVTEADLKLLIRRFARMHHATAISVVEK
jgi:8-oxo-dGTP pyrophosphatase MutT (NUDIX family)